MINHKIEKVHGNLVKITIGNNSIVLSDNLLLEIILGKRLDTSIGSIQLLDTTICFIDQCYYTIPIEQIYQYLNSELQNLVFCIIINSFRKTIETLQNKISDLDHGLWIK